MKRYIYLTAALLGAMGLLAPSAEAGNLTALRVSNHDGTSRVVFDLSEMPVSWTSSYNEADRSLTLNLGGTKNGLTAPVTQNSSKTGVLKGVGLQNVNGSLQVTLTANRDVQHHAFTLKNPTRIIVDLFSNYSQQTTKDINKSIKYSKISNTVGEGKIQAFALAVDNTSPMVASHVPEGKALSGIQQKHTAAIGAKVKGGRSFEQPYTVASNGAVDLERIGNRGTLRYTPNRGYFIEEKRPSLQAKAGKQSFTITSVNTPRKENALTLYTPPSYGNSTKTNDFGYEVTVANGKVVSHRKGNSPIGANQYVLSGAWRVSKRLAQVKGRNTCYNSKSTGFSAGQYRRRCCRSGRYTGNEKWPLCRC
nr:AMIN domain-containing protein [Veillonella denticariosi]